MKKLIFTISLAIAALLSFAQIPQTFSYQGVVRDAESKIVAEKPITVSVQILQGTDEGTEVYAETHEVTTNANGLMTFELGSKNAEDFAKIDWSNAPYFVKTVATFDGKQISGVTPLLAVPYALYAAKAGNADVDLSEYAKKTELPEAVDLSEYYKKSDVDNLLAELNEKVKKLDKQLNPVVGAIQAGFSVSRDKQVYFSNGNLQYQASTNTWRFAEHQWDYVGYETYGTVYENDVKCNNAEISDTYDGWIDLFGWGTSGYNGKYPYMNIENSDDYGDGENNIAGTNYDWGIYNKISNGGNQVGLWHTLTTWEWSYLIRDRENASNKFGAATVNGVKGLVLLPDEWTLPDGLAFNDGSNHDMDYTQNIYSVEEWIKMEANGAVFLPAAGDRVGTSPYYGRNDGYYWTNTHDGSSYAESFYFIYIGGIHPCLGGARNSGRSVRLVQDAE